MAFEELDYDQWTEENCTENQTKILTTVKSNPSTLRRCHWSRENIPLTRFDFPI